jgi:hypothetical protein
VEPQEDVEVTTERWDVNLHERKMGGGGKLGFREMKQNGRKQSVI